MVTGDAAGSTESFSLSSTSTSALGFTDVTSASDASLTVNGVSYTRQTNTISDIVTGVTLDLKATSTTAASVMVSRDTSVIQTKLDELVVAYNDFNNILTETANPDSTLDTYGGTLVGNNTLRIVRQQMRNILLGTSSTGSGAMTSLGQLGLSLDQKGVMSLDATKVTSALQNNFDEVTKMFTGGYNNLSTYSTLPAGIAGDAVRKLSNLLSNTGPLVTQTENANTQNDKYRETLAKLQVRLDAILARYTKQFAAMDSLVGSVNTQKTSLKSTFDGMMASYTNK
jgi:flagellar hook-associated protein 2